MKTSILLSLLGCLALFSCDKTNDSEKPIKVGDWTVQKIGDFQPIGQISAECDKNDHLHVLTAFSDEKLNYLTNSSDTWKSTTLFTCASNYLLNAYSNVAVDDNNQIHCALHTSKNSMSDPDTKLYYISNKSGSFQTEVIPVTATPASGIWILSKSDNIVHIFYGSLDMQVIYLTNLSGSWSQKVIGNYWTSLVPKAAFDSDGNIYVALEEGWDRVLRLAIINTNGDLVSNSVIDNTTGDTGWSPSIAINPDNNDLIISYWESATDNLKLYHNGLISTVVSCPWSEGNIKFDKNGKYYFTYYTIESLNMGTNESGELKLTTLPFTAVTRYSDLAIQSDGKINIFFNDKSSYKLTMISK